MNEARPHEAGAPAQPSRSLIALLAALAALGALATNIILPSFPSIGTELHATPTMLSITLSAYFLVIATGQLLVGPLSDQFGRRYLVIGGLCLFSIGSLVCALAPDVSTLVAGRVVQAAGVCAASVLARAIARDLFQGDALSRVLSMTVVAMAAAPGFSPLLGGLAERFIGWRAIFLLLGGSALLLALWYGMALRETHPRSSRTRLAAGATIRGYIGLATDARFIGPAGAISLLMGALYGLFVAAPTVLMGQMGFSPVELGLFFAGTVVVVFAAGMSVPRLSKRWGARRTTSAGLAIALAGGVLAICAGLQAPGSFAAFLLASCVFLFGMGTANPLGTALALAPFGSQAGSASALLGFLQMAGAAVGASLVASFSAIVTVSLGILMVILLAFALTVLRVSGGAPHRQAST